MRDFNDFQKVLKKIGVDAVNANKPVRILYGKVTSTNPLQVNVEQRFVLDEPFLILTGAFEDLETSISVRDNYRNSNDELISRDQDYQVSIDRSLKQGERVVLLQEQGGQKFVVLDRVI